MMEIAAPVTIDGQVQESSCMLLGNLLGVTATLEDHELIFGAPAIRRRFLDEQIAQIDPFYVVQLSRYTRALSARNRLLKARDCRTIGAWEEQLAKAGAYIVHQRRQTVSLLSPRVICAYQSLFQKKMMLLHFQCDISPNVLRAKTLSHGTKGSLLRVESRDKSRFSHW